MKTPLDTYDVVSAIVKLTLGILFTIAAVGFIVLIWRDIHDPLVAITISCILLAVVGFIGWLMWEIS